MDDSEPMDSGSLPPDAVRVLLTGFGPSFLYDENPSWLAAKPLNDYAFVVNPPPESMVVDTDKPLPPTPDLNPHLPKPVPFDRPRLVHITSVCLPATYQAVLDIAPGFHAQPPILPPDEDPAHRCEPPPDDGYDFIFHLGQAGRGVLRLERVAHRTGYRLKDKLGEHAPLCETHMEHIPVSNVTSMDSPDEPPADLHVGLPLSNNQLARLRSPGLRANGEDEGDVIEVHPLAPPAEKEPPKRGFDKGYDNFADDIHTAIHVEKLVSDMKLEDIPYMYSSLDAGHHVSDFLYYCSLAEAKRAAQRPEKPKQTKVLFMHCPPVGNPLTTDQVITAVKKIVEWVAKEEILSPDPPEPPRVEFVVREGGRRDGGTGGGGPPGSGGPPPPPAGGGPSSHS